MSRPLFLVKNCHGLFFDVTGIFAKIVTGTQKNVTGKKKHWPQLGPFPDKKKVEVNLRLFFKTMVDSARSVTFSLQHKSGLALLRVSLLPNLLKNVII